MTPCPICNGSGQTPRPFKMVVGSSSFIEKSCCPGCFGKCEVDYERLAWLVNHPGKVFGNSKGTTNYYRSNTDKKKAGTP